MTRRSLYNIFSDKSSLMPRRMLEHPGKKWTTLDFVREGLSAGLASEGLARAEALGYVERLNKGPKSYTRLIRKENLLKDWLRSYSFDKSLQTYYYYPKPDFLRACIQYLETHKIQYALTLFSASRLISPYVKDDRHFLYLDLDRTQFSPFLKEMETQIGLLKLIKGGNVCFAVPFYTSSVFRDSRKVRGYRVVSNLQLYLDLMGFPPLGHEEAGHLVVYLKKRGISFV